MTLLFIDTNIFFDFYRQVGRESNLSILKHLRPHHDRIITALVQRGVAYRGEGTVVTTTN